MNFSKLILYLRKRHLDLATLKNLMRLEDDDDAQENVPMLPSSSSVHGSIEIEDGPPVRFLNTGGSDRPKTPGSNSHVVRWARRRFSMLYIVLGIITLIALAVLVVAIFLALRVKRMDEHYDRVSKDAGNQFRKLYEQVALFRNGRHGTFKDVDMKSIADHLTPEQLAQAKAFGLIPSSANQLPPGINGLEPIKPVDNLAQYDDPSAIPNVENNKQHWSAKECNQKCQKFGYENPPLVVLSLDGFAREYLDRKLVPSLEKLTNCGSRAEFIYPSYPSKTFPNHYTIATGLYPESHGIVDNGGYDPTISPNFEDFKKTKYAKFYNGEPIWSQVVRHGKKMFCLFWPGCSFNITGHNPTMDLPYNRSLQYSDRVDMIVEWLKFPVEERPSLIMAYFDQPDYIGHFHTTDEQVNLELKYLNTVLDYLFTKLHDENLMDCSNIILLSDHGMQFLHKRIYLNETIDTTGMVVANGVVGRLHMANSSKSVNEIISNLTCPADKSFLIFDRHSTPKRFHYSKIPRVGDIILDGKPGTTFYGNSSQDYHVTSDHGYDYLYPEMHAIFFAHGPNIVPGLTLPSFQNLELFNLFVDLLKLPHEVPNNGTAGLLRPLLKDLTPLYPPKSIFLHVVSPCLPSVLYSKKEIKTCTQNPVCETKITASNTILDSCHLPKIPLNFFHTEEPNYCLIDFCGTSLVTAPAKKSENRALAVYESLTASEAEIMLKNQQSPEENNDCLLIDARFDTCFNISKDEKSGYKLESILANSLTEMNDLRRTQFLLFEQFSKGPFDYLQNLTHHYAKTYSRLVIITGTIYDFDLNGLADELKENSDVSQQPTHIYRILMRCENNKWHLDGHRCETPADTRVLSFVIKNEEKETNCLSPNEYLFLNTARVRDIELLTGIHFFEEPFWYSEIESLRIRTNITQKLWDTN